MFMVLRRVSFSITTVAGSTPVQVISKVQSVTGYCFSASPSRYPSEIEPVAFFGVTRLKLLKAIFVAANE